VWCSKFPTLLPLHSSFTIFDMPSFKDLAELDSFLASRSYIEGYTLSAADKSTFETFGASALSTKSKKHAFRWALHIAAVAGLEGAFTNASVAVASVNVESTAAVETKKADDDMDIFDYGEDNEEVDAEQAAADKARRSRIAAALKLKKDKDLADGKVKKDKEKPAEKSLIVLDVKPWEAQDDAFFKTLWDNIVKFQQDGLSWGASYKLEPVAFGVRKLVLTCTIEDAKVLMDDVTDNIEAMEDFVQSVTVASMNKL
jgi:elongation factor 1-beta